MHYIKYAATLLAALCTCNNTLAQNPSSDATQLGLIEFGETGLLTSLIESAPAKIFNSPWQLDIDGLTFKELWEASIHIFAQRGVIAGANREAGVLIILNGPLSIANFHGISDKIVLTPAEAKKFLEQPHADVSLRAPHAIGIRCNPNSATCQLYLDWWPELLNTTSNPKAWKVSDRSKVSAINKLREQLVIVGAWDIKWNYLTEPLNK